MAKYYISGLGGGSKVGQAVALAPTIHGTTLSGLAYLKDVLPASSFVSPGELDQAVHCADQLQAPAADIRHEGALAGEREVVRHRAVGEGGLGLGIDDAEGNVQLLAHPADEPGAVFGLPHRGGGHRGDPPHAPSLADLAHPAEGLDGPVHGGVVQASRPGQTGREARRG